MRTKLIILSAIAGIFGSASLMAQTTNVYSLNAVGYINVTCPPGFSIIANQLNTTNNTVFGLLPVDPGGADDGTTVYKWNGKGFAAMTMDSLNSPSPWLPQSTPQTTTLNPGEAIFINNAATEADGVTPTNYVVTFVGQVPQGTFTNTINPGFNMISSVIPQAGNIETVLNLTPSGLTDPSSPVSGNDAIYFWVNNGSGGGSYLPYTENDNGVDNGLGNFGPTLAANPSPNVGQGFWYNNSDTNAVAWVRTFSVQ